MIEFPETGRLLAADVKHVFSVELKVGGSAVGSADGLFVLAPPISLITDLDLLNRFGLVFTFFQRNRKRLDSIRTGDITPASNPSFLEVFVCF